MLAKLSASRSGVALVEFAFGLPVVLLIGIGGVELANLTITHLTASRIASLTADNASRVRDSIDEADVIDIFKAAQLSSGASDLGENGRIILSALQVNEKGNGQWIRWQRCYGAMAVAPRYGREGTGVVGSALKGMGPAARMVSADAGTTVMFVELEIKYKSIVPQYWSRGSVVRYESAFNVRKRPNAYPTNTNNSVNLATRIC